MRVLVCGGRNYDDQDTLDGVLNAIYANTPITEILHGGASGADAMADDWATLAGVRSRSFPAQWKTFGRRAGPIRNGLMLLEGKPDLVVAFPGGAGTRDMVAQAKRKGVPVRAVKKHGDVWSLTDA